MSTVVGSERLRDDILLKRGYHAAEGLTFFFRYDGGNNSRRCLLDSTETAEQVGHVRDICEL
jgi:hypothetical protein